MKKEIPQAVRIVLANAAQKYSESPSTTNAGRVLRFIAKFVTQETVAKLFSHVFKIK